jgi:hypothetical protein
MLELALQRLWLTEKSSCGELSIDGKVLCYSLELPVKDGLPGSAIPPGRYQIELQPSPKFLSSGDPWIEQFASKMPHLARIPNRSLIMLHWGNRPENTDGCILVGLTHDVDEVGESRLAFESLYRIIEGSATIGDCWITVQGGIPQILTDPELSTL